MKPDPAKTYDTIVIGGGIVGISTAYHLVCGGAKTLLIDRKDPGRATDAGAGIIAAATNTRDLDAWFTFAVEAVHYYPDLIARLQLEQEGDTGYAVCGKITVAVTEDEIQPFEETRQIVFQRQRDRGAPSPDELYEISSDEARRLFPPLGEVHGAFRYHNGARVDGRLLAAALEKSADARGLERLSASVEKLEIKGEVVTGVQIEGETFSASTVAIAGGAWSDAFGHQLRVKIPVIPQRGQIIHLGLDGIDTSDWPIVSALRGHYMVPWPDSRVVVGATRETGSGFDTRTSAEGVKEVIGEALRVAPGLANAEILDIRVGLRPCTEDNLPVMGPVPGFRNIILATGHGSTGLQLGPYSGKVISDLMLGIEPETDISPFHVTRFQ
jgi:D-amino-acid dehydrogenase